MDKTKYRPFKYRGVKYHLAYVQFKILKGSIFSRRNRICVYISNDLSSREKSRELHKLLKAKSKFKKTGKRDIPPSLRELFLKYR